MSTIVALLGLTAFCQLASAVGPIVSIPLGQLEGWEGKTRGGRIYEAWTKVPYAQPPVGKLRLNPPKRPTPWNGVLQATNATPACMQNTDGPPDLPVPNFSTEDCLYLDIYRPKDPKIKNLPVLVYIHGGAFAGGDVGGKHSADYLMDEDVILVQVNYRVNGFGFMSLGDDVLPGNYGQKDQAQALMWLNRNIQYFGGNRRRMTVFGESSGGASAHFLLKSPMTSKFLAGAVSHSGSINHVSTTLNTQFVRNNTLAVAAKVGCQGTDSRKIKKCLQTVDAEKLVDAISEVSDDPIQLFFAPVIEPRTVKGAFATEDLAVQSTQKPWIITFANGEYGLYVMKLRTKTDYVKNAAKNIDKYLENFLLIHTKNRDKIRKAVTVLKATYFKAKMTYSKFVEQLAKLHADNNFIYPAIFNANNHEGKTWLCQLEYSSSASRMSPNVHIAGHASHTDFYFNRGGRSGALRRAFPEMSKRLIKYLVNFAKYGNPTPKGSKINWPQFNSFEMLRIIGETDVVSTKPYFQTFQNLYDMWFSAIGWK